MLKNRNCKLCNSEYTPTGRGQKYCGGYYKKGTCAYKARLARNKAKNYYGYRPKNGNIYYSNYGKINTPCEWCKSFEKLSIDHIKPQMIGGSDEKNNLRILCRSCNSKRHHRLIKNALIFYFECGFKE